MGEWLTFQPLPAAKEDSEDPLWHTRQGPLTSAAYMDVGSFGSLLDVADGSTGPDEALDLTLTVRLIVFVGSKLHLAGAVRTFCVQGRRGEAEVRPESLLPTQLANWHERRVVRAWLEEASSLERGDIATPVSRGQE